MLVLILSGLIIGVFGSVVGVGGGFLLTPVLMLMYPKMPAQTITSISMLVVSLNTISSSLAYSRLKRIDYKAGVVFVISALPGIVIGTIITSHISRSAFDLIFCAILLALAVFLLADPYKSVSAGKRRHLLSRMITDTNGVSYNYKLHIRRGVLLSLIIGFISGLTGIGGGIFQVPGMVLLLHFPVHIATATSHFVLAFNASTSTLIHLFHGDFLSSWFVPLFLAPGIIIGSQVGARYSGKINQVFMLRGVAVALIIAAMKMLLF